MGSSVRQFVLFLFLRLNVCLISQGYAPGSYSESRTLVVFLHRDVRPLQTFLPHGVFGKCLFRSSQSNGLTSYRAGAPSYLCIACLPQVPVSLIAQISMLNPQSTPRHDILYATYILAGVYATFKPYPTLSDPGLFISLISLFPETYQCEFRRSLVF